MKSLAGHLLIASPYLADGNFFRSVVLIVSHDEDHAFGLLLNRPGHAGLHVAWKQLTGSACVQQPAVRTGGPLEGTLMILHGLPRYSDATVIPGVELASQWETVSALVDSGAEDLVPLSGYSGWGPQQLEGELEAGGWLTLPATAEIVFATPDEQWHLATREVGNDILGGVAERHAPKDTRWN